MWNTVKRNIGYILLILGVWALLTGLVVLVTGCSTPPPALVQIRVEADPVQEVRLDGLSVGCTPLLLTVFGNVIPNYLELRPVGSDSLVSCRLILHDCIGLKVISFDFDSTGNTVSSERWE